VILLLLLAATIWAIVFAPPRPCQPRTDDPQGYLYKTCLYVRDNQIDVSPADPTQYSIKRIEEGEENGREVVWVFLNCCYLGDIAIIDKETGEVIDFRVGAK
jgi:hypothetical protein